MTKDAVELIQEMIDIFKRTQSLNQVLDFLEELKSGELTMRSVYSLRILKGWNAYEDNNSISNLTKYNPNVEFGVLVGIAQEKLDLVNLY